MDERRFDELTKALVAAKPSRRVALRRLAGGALVTVFGGLALEGASAQRVGIEARTCGQGCSSNGQCNACLQCGAGSEECVAKPDSEDPCTGNGDCPENYETCNNSGKCVNSVGNCKDAASGDCERAGYAATASASSRSARTTAAAARTRSARTANASRKISPRHSPVLVLRRYSGLDIRGPGARVRNVARRLEKRRLPAQSSYTAS